MERYVVREMGKDLQLLRVPLQLSGAASAEVFAIANFAVAELEIASPAQLQLVEEHFLGGNLSNRDGQ